MGKILIIAGDFVEDYEVMVPFQTLKTLGYDVHVVCPGKKNGEAISTAVHDFEGYQTYTEKRGHNFVLNYDFENIRPEEYDSLILPGGRSPEYLRLNNEVLTIVQKFCHETKPVAAICHGVQLLVAGGVLNGVRTTGYASVAPEVRNAGGCWVDVPMDEAVVYKNFITAPAWPAHPNWLRGLIDLMGGNV